MTTLKVIVVDDEALSRDYMAGILYRIEGVEVVAMCANGRQAVIETQTRQPDLLLLDIQMPGMDGFEVVKALQADAMPMVIFATAYDEYALKAFELHAVDYVLKPFEPDRVEMAIERARQRRLSAQLLENKSVLMRAIDHLAEPDRRAASESSTPPLQKLSIRDGATTVMVPLEEIDWVDAAGDYMCVHASGTTHVMRSTMKELEDKLTDPRFARVHRSTLVNLDKVTAITPLPKGECQLHLQGDAVVKVSRNYRYVVESIRG